MTEAKQLIERAIHQILTEKHGPGAVTRRPLSVRYPVEVDAPSDLRAAISAAKYAAHVAEGLMREYARQARGHGLTWAEIAPSVIDVEDVDYGADPAVEAFRWVAPTPSMQFDTIYTYWSCSTCGEHITDNGPYDGPAEDETGHADTCTRHMADVAAARARWGD